MSPVRKFIYASWGLVKLRLISISRLLKIARYAIVGDLAFELWAGESKIFRA
jgi:hypothetical protein